MGTYLEGWASRDGAGSLEAMSRMGPSFSWWSRKGFAGYDFVSLFFVQFEILKYHNEMHLCESWLE